MCYELTDEVDKARRAYEEASKGFLGDEAVEQLTLLTLRSERKEAGAPDVGESIDVESN